MKVLQTHIDDPANSAWRHIVFQVLHVLRMRVIKREKVMMQTNWNKEIDNLCETGSMISRNKKFCPLLTESYSSTVRFPPTLMAPHWVTSRTMKKDVHIL